MMWIFYDESVSDKTVYEELFSWWRREFDFESLTKELDPDSAYHRDLELQDALRRLTTLRYFQNLKVSMNDLLWISGNDGNTRPETDLMYVSIIDKTYAEECDGLSWWGTTILPDGTIEIAKAFRREPQPSCVAFLMPKGSAWYLAFLARKFMNFTTLCKLANKDVKVYAVAKSDDAIREMGDLGERYLALRQRLQDSVFLKKSNTSNSMLVVDGNIELLQMTPMPTCVGAKVTLGSVEFSEEGLAIIEKILDDLDEAAKKL